MRILRNAVLVAAVLVASAFAQTILTGTTTNTVNLCKNEGDPDCVTAIGYTMFKVDIGPMGVTDGFREIARIDKDGKVTISEGVTPEYVIRMMAYYWQEQTKDSYETHQAELNACMDGWKHTLTVLKIALKPHTEASK